MYIYIYIYILLFLRTKYNKLNIYCSIGSEPLLQKDERNKRITINWFDIGFNSVEVRLLSLKN